MGKRKADEGTIFYGGTYAQVWTQLNCAHDWYGPGEDTISRFYKCSLCHAIMRPLNEKQFYQILKEQELVIGLPNIILENEK